MRSRRSGHSVLEFAFFLPFLLFLFVGAFDWGFYSWALISTENAARVAALYTSGSSTTAADSAGACNIATAEMADAPNVAANPGVSGTTLKGGGSAGSLGSGGGSGGGGNNQNSGGSGGSGNLATCSAPPLTVTATSISSGADGAAASQVSITYQTPVLIPIPGLLTGQISITRVVQMKVRS
jgi:Flp pilus assembly protein TadG